MNTMKYLLLSLTVSLCFQTYSQQKYPRPMAKTTTHGIFHGYENEAGEVIIPAKFHGASHFYFGLAQITDENGKVGFINEKGEIVIPCQFEDAGNFRSANSPERPANMTTVRKKFKEMVEEERNKYDAITGITYKVKEKRERMVSHYGVINRKGELVIPFRTKEDVRASGFEGDLAVVIYHGPKNERGSWEQYQCIINSSGEILMGPFVSDASLIITPAGILRYTGESILKLDKEYDDKVRSIYDTEFNLIAGNDRLYSWVDYYERMFGGKYWIVSRMMNVGGKREYLKGLLDMEGNEVLPTLYYDINYDWESELAVLFISPKTDYSEGLFYYINDKLECVEYNEVKCPEEPDVPFDKDNYYKKDHNLITNDRVDYSAIYPPPECLGEGFILPMQGQQDGTDESAGSQATVFTSGALIPIPEEDLMSIIKKCNNNDMGLAYPIGMEASPVGTEDNMSSSDRKYYDPWNATDLESLLFSTWKTAPVESPSEISMIIHFPGTYRMRYLVFQNSYVYGKRIKEASITYSDGTVQTIQIGDDDKVQNVFELQPVEAQYAELKVLSFHNEDVKSATVGQVHFFGDNMNPVISKKYTGKAYENGKKDASGYTVRFFDLRDFRVGKYSGACSYMMNKKNHGQCTLTLVKAEDNVYELINTYSRTLVGDVFNVGWARVTDNGHSLTMELFEGKYGKRGDNPKPVLKTDLVPGE